MLAGREMPVERADADLRPLGDLLQRGIDAMLGEGLRRHLDQLVTIALRIGAQRLGRRRIALFGSLWRLVGQFFLHERNMGLEPMRVSPHVNKRRRLRFSGVALSYNQGKRYVTWRRTES